MSDVDDKLNDKLASTWRDASREEPPAVLDASLRAAARRAVQAGPGRASQERHMRSWPLATAAVLAVLSFGILQLTPPDEVTPGMVAENNVQPSAARQVEQAAPVAENKKVFREAAPDADAERDRGSAQMQLAQAPAPAPAAAPASAPATAPPSGAATAPAKQELRKDKQNSVDALATLEAREQTELAAARSRLAAKDDKALAPAPAANAGGPAAAPPAAPATSASPAIAAAPPPDPFPAAGSANTKANEVEPRSPVQAGAVAPARPATPLEERAKLGAMADSASPPTAAAAGAAKPQANVEMRRAEQMQSTAPEPLAKSGVAADAVKDAPIKPPEEWIKLIRKLRSEGRNDDATRELAAFRAAYKERADALLPADLRALPR